MRMFTRSVAIAANGSSFTSEHERPTKSLREVP